MPAVIIVGTWRDMGYYMLLFLAGLQTVPRELYEAARVDGANAWQRFWNVTLPGLRPTMFFVTVMLTIGVFKIFDLILVHDRRRPRRSRRWCCRSTSTRRASTRQFGYASAVAVVLFVICILVDRRPVPRQQAEER